MLIYDALKKDHEKVKGLLDELIALTEGDPRRNQLIKSIRDELIPHARAEESILYNSLRSIDATKDLVREGFQEHVEAEALLRTLQMKDKIDADWRTTAGKLKEALAHHIREEETAVFAAAQEYLTEREAEMMGEAFEKMKPEIRRENILQTTVDLIANMMPPRFASVFRDRTFEI